MENTREILHTSPEGRTANQVFDVEEMRLFAMHLVDQWDGPQYIPMQNEREFNARTSIMERLTASGHLSSVEFEGDMDEVFDQLFSRLLNAITTQSVGWEQKRNFHELVEAIQVVELFKLVSSGQIDPNSKIVTHSDFPDECSIESSHDFGYRSLNMKGMVRATWFEKGEDDNWKMLIKQASRSNSHDGTSARFIEQFGEVDEEILATQVVYTGDIITIIRNLDEMSGTVYGDAPTSTEALEHPSYEELEEISALRESRITEFVEELSEYEVYLDTLLHGGLIDYQEKLGLYREKEDKIIHKTCLLEPSYARAAMGEKSAEYIEQAAMHMATGNHEMGRVLFHEARQVVDKRASVGCGGNGSKRPDENPGDFGESQDLYNEAGESKSGWKWKKGVCRVESCSSRPGETEVGPCEVCHSCQHKFDQGKDPTKYSVRSNPEKKFQFVMPSFMKKEDVEDDELQLAA